MAFSEQAGGFAPEAWWQAWQQSCQRFMTGLLPTGFGVSGASPWAGMPGGGFGPVAGAMNEFPALAGMFSGFQAMAGEAWSQVQAAVSRGEGMGEAAMGAWQEALRAAGLFQGADETQWRAALSAPQVGPWREHLERWNQMQLAQLDYRQAAMAFGEELAAIARETAERFQRDVAAHAEPGRQIQTPRALLDAWVEAGEAVWAERANSEHFIAAFGRYTNAELRMRAALQGQTNRIAAAMGLPTREEVDADHRRIAVLERQLRRMDAEIATLRAAMPQPQAVSQNVVPIRPEVAQDAADAMAQPARKPRKRTKAAAGAAVRNGANALGASISVLPIVTPPRAFGPGEQASRRGKRAGK